MRLKGKTIDRWKDEVRFQFQTGAIKRKIKKNDNLFVCRFQFQTGAIKSGMVSRTSERDNEFQFQTGAIKSCIPPSRLRMVMEVSIPNWCD